MQGWCCEWLQFTATDAGCESCGALKSELQRSPLSGLGMLLHHLMPCYLRAAHLWFPMLDWWSGL